VAAAAVVAAAEKVFRGDEEDGKPNSETCFPSFVLFFNFFFI
jgi:hypothetical protein